MPVRRRLTPDARRRQLLEAALVVFAELGYDGASLEAIARQAGVTKPVVYRHFASKQALHVAVLQAEAEALLRALAARGRGDTVEDRVADAMLAVFEVNRAHPYAWRVLVATRGVDPAAAELQRAFQDAADTAVAERILDEPGFSPPAGLARVTAARALARLVRSGVDGLLGWWLEHPEVTERQMTAIAMDVLWSGLASVAAGRGWSRPSRAMLSPVAG